MRPNIIGFGGFTRCNWHAKNQEIKSPDKASMSIQKFMVILKSVPPTANLTDTAKESMFINHSVNHDFSLRSKDYCLNCLCFHSVLFWFCFIHAWKVKLRCQHAEFINKMMLVSYIYICQVENQLTPTMVQFYHSIHWLRGKLWKFTPLKNMRHLKLFWMLL